MAGKDDLVGERALAGHDEEVVVGVDVNGLRRRLVLARGVHGVVVAVAGEVDGNVFHAVGEHRVLLHLRGRTGHVNARTDAEFFRRERDTLRVVSGGCRDDAARRLQLGERGHAVRRAAPFIGLDLGKILAFHPDFRAVGNGQPLQRGGLPEVIHALPRQQDFLAELFVEGGRFVACHARMVSGKSARGQQKSAHSGFELPA